MCLLGQIMLEVQLCTLAQRTYPIPYRSFTPFAEDMTVIHSLLEILNAPQESVVEGNIEAE